MGRPHGCDWMDGCSINLTWPTGFCWRNSFFEVYCFIQIFIFVSSMTTSGKSGALEVESYSVKVNTCNTSRSDAPGKAVTNNNMAWWQGDREPALWKLLILLFTPVIFLWWRVKMAHKNNKGVGLLRASNQPKYVKTHVVVGNKFIN